MSLREDLQAKLIRAIEGEPRIFLGRPLAEARPEHKLRDDLGIDSVGLLYLVLIIEDQFMVEVDDAEALAENFRTWGELLDFLEARA